MSTIDGDSHENLVGPFVFNMSASLLAGSQPGLAWLELLGSCELSSAVFEAATADATGHGGAIWNLFIEWASSSPGGSEGVRESAIAALGHDPAIDGGILLWSKLIDTATSSVAVAREALQTVRQANDNDDDRDDDDDDDLDAAEQELESMLASAVSQARSLFQRRLALPLPGGSELLARYVDFEAGETIADVTAPGCATTDSSIQSAVDAFHAAQAALSVRQKYEDGVASAWAAYQSASAFASELVGPSGSASSESVDTESALRRAVTALVSAWTAYLDAESSGSLAAATAAAVSDLKSASTKGGPRGKKQREAHTPPDPSFLAALHERAVREAHWDPGLWRRLGALFEGPLRSPARAIGVYRRAVRCAPHEPSLWLSLVNAVEQCYTDAVAKVQAAADAAEGTAAAQDAVAGAQLVELADTVARFLDSLAQSNTSSGAVAAGAADDRPPSLLSPVPRVASACLGELERLVARCVGGGPVFPSAYDYVAVLRAATEAGRRIATLGLAGCAGGVPAAAEGGGADANVEIGPALPPGASSSPSSPSGSLPVDSATALVAAARRLWGRCLQCLQASYPGWEEPAAWLLSYVAQAESECVASALEQCGQRAAAGEAHAVGDRWWDALLSCAGREPSAVQTAVGNLLTGLPVVDKSIADSALLHPRTLLDRALEAVACARSSHRLPRCRFLFATSKQRLVTAKAPPRDYYTAGQAASEEGGDEGGEGRVPEALIPGCAALDMVAPLCAAWLALESAVGGLSDVTAAREKAATATAEVERRRSQQAAKQQRMAPPPQLQQQHQQRKQVSSQPAAGRKRARADEADEVGGDSENRGSPSAPATGGKRARTAAASAVEESEGPTGDGATPLDPTPAQQAETTGDDRAAADGQCGDDDGDAQEEPSPPAATRAGLGFGLAAFLGAAKAAAQEAPAPLQGATVPSRGEDVQQRGVKQPAGARVARGPPPTPAGTPAEPAQPANPYLQAPPATLGGCAGKRSAGTGASTAATAAAGKRRGWLSVAESSHPAVSAPAPAPSSAPAHLRGPQEGQQPEADATSAPARAPAPASAAPVLEPSLIPAPAAAGVMQVDSEAPGAAPSVAGVPKHTPADAPEPGPDAVAHSVSAEPAPAAPHDIASAGESSPGGDGSRSRGPEELHPTAVAVHNLPYARAVQLEKEVAAAFAPAGRVTRVHLATNKAGACKGYGWVRFDSPDGSRAAMRLNKAAVVSGRPVIVSRVKWATVEGYPEKPPQAVPRVVTAGAGGSSAEAVSDAPASSSSAPASAQAPLAAPRALFKPRTMARKVGAASAPAPTGQLAASAGTTAAAVGGGTGTHQPSGPAAAAAGPGPAVTTEYPSAPGAHLQLNASNVTSIAS